MELKASTPTASDGKSHECKGIGTNDALIVSCKRQHSSQRKYYRHAFIDWILPSNDAWFSIIHRFNKIFLIKVVLHIRPVKAARLRDYMSLS